ncbi:glycosyltransferase family 32 protein [Vibrio sp. 10N.222.55.F12]|uniref:glycosyltransferase family 32 protein n=1 Tax=Vibrio sp. 10N.222.55.F12 TaxID=3229653 RepID=UPI00354DAB26
MIPKIIHYCWFGPNKKPKSVHKYIQGWRDKLPDYEIKEWNESNFDIECIEYVKQAYAGKKFAFVADYARLKALYEYGGIYLDTDVEVVQDIGKLLVHHKSDVILGFEEKNWVCTSTIVAKPGSEFIKDFLDSYHGKIFNTGGSIDTTTNVNMLTNWLRQLGLKQDGTLQSIDYKNSLVAVLPQEYLSPMDYIHRIDNRTENTITVHHYDITWGKKEELVIRYIKLMAVRVFGKKLTLKFWAWFR